MIFPVIKHKRHFWRLHRAICLVVVLLFFYGHSFAVDALEIGSKAPNILGNDALNGQRVNLYRVMSELQFKRDKNGMLIRDKNGKYINEFKRYVVVLSFFSRTCIPCIREIPTLNRIANRYRNHDVKLLYINVDPELSREQARRFIETYSIEVPMMLCNQAEAIRKYDARVLPRLVVIDRDKKIAQIITGLDKQLEASLDGIIQDLLPQSEQTNQL